MDSNITTADMTAALSLCNEFNPRNPGMAKAICLLVAKAREEGRFAPDGHVLTSDGIARRALGTLPVTGDGCVLGWGEYTIFMIGTVTVGDDDRPGVVELTDYVNIPDYPHDLYSTRESAQAALDAAKGTNGTGR